MNKQQNQVEQPYGYIFDGRLLSFDQLSGMTFSEQSKPVPVYTHPIPEPATGSEWPSDEEIDDMVDQILLSNHPLATDTPFRQGFKMGIDLMRSRLPVTPKVEWDELFNDLGKFTVEKFPDAGPKEHLKKLIIEAIEAIDDPTDITEYADCLLAVFGAAYKAGFTSHLLYRAGCDKMIINKKREWEKLPDGTYQHKSAITTPPQITREK